MKSETSKRWMVVGNDEQTLETVATLLRKPFTLPALKHALEYVQTGLINRTEFSGAI
jgi:hypothetical protein